MDRTERFYRILNLLNTRRAVPREAFLRTLEVSAATFKRDLEYLRDRLDAPVVWDRELRGYRLATAPGRFQLPGLWLTQGELLSMVVAETMLAELEPALIGETLRPLRDQMERLVSELPLSVGDFRDRLRFVGATRRPVCQKVLRALLEALVSRRQLQMTYLTRGRGADTTRTVSPQRLVRYRDNWYLDAWCHLREGLRTFAVDAISEASVRQTEARTLPAETLDAHVHPGFGIFSGTSVQWATLAFSAEVARWVAAEQWHPDQRSHWCEDGTFRLEVPYAEDQELLMEILKFGAGCRVLAPESLQRRVREEAASLIALYGEATAPSSASPE